MHELSSNELSGEAFRPVINAGRHMYIVRTAAMFHHEEILAEISIIRFLHALASILCILITFTGTPAIGIGTGSSSSSSSGAGAGSDSGPVEVPVPAEDPRWIPQWEASQGADGNASKIV